MCSILGFVGRVSNTLLRELYRTAAPYGPHSVGLLYVENDVKLKAFKRATTPTLFLRNNNHRIERAARFTQCIGHTRYATHGQVIDKNAHPFNEGDDIWFVHNGIISNYRQIMPTAVVDSECLGTLIKSRCLADANGRVGVAWMERDTSTGIWSTYAYRRNQSLTAFVVSPVEGLVLEPTTILVKMADMLPHELRSYAREVKLEPGVAYRVSPSGLEEVWRNSAIDDQQRQSYGLYRNGVYAGG